MRSITFIIGPVIFLQTFRWFIDPKNGNPVPGAPFVLASGLLFTAMLMATRIKYEGSHTVSTETGAPISPAEMTATGAAPINETKESI
ncbi:MAG TPA: hypothetical protein VFA58_05305, partial [Chthoniobacterales bacterium]|nr:hypothetical protein [Chthoniobacterales bacterium]